METWQGTEALILSGSPEQEVGYVARFCRRIRLLKSSVPTPGTRHLAKLHCHPDLIVGDFDSQCLSGYRLRAHSAGTRRRHTHHARLAGCHRSRVHLRLGLPVQPVDGSIICCPTIFPYVNMPGSAAAPAVSWMRKMNCSLSIPTPLNLHGMIHTSIFPSFRWTTHCTVSPSQVQNIRYLMHRSRAARCTQSQTK